jgi:hypothetical protein
MYQRIPASGDESPRLAGNGWLTIDYPCRPVT